jgi:Uma2 family endonuclease
MPTTPTAADPLVQPEVSLGTPASTPVPTLDEIVHLEPGERKVFRGVSWGFYERVHAVIGERRWLRVAFDGRDLEIMPIGRVHERVVDFAFRLIEIITEELEIPSESTGSTTWSRPEIERGIEADQSLYFTPDKLAASAEALARGAKDAADYPNPDLAIEVDISESKVDRPGIYAALQVPEIWRFSESSVIIERLTDQGTYSEVEQSPFLRIRPDEVARWVLHEDRSNLLDWKRRLRAWVRAELSNR